MENIIQITNGPSREDLFDGLRLVAENRKVIFSIIYCEKEIPLSSTIERIGDEDGSGQSWNLVVNFDSNSLLQHSLPGNFRQILLNNISRVYYSTKNRKGVISY